MSRRAWTFLGLGGLAVGLSVAAAAGPLEAERPADLSAEVRSLRERVEALEKRLGALESAGQAVMIPSEVTRELPQPPWPGRDLRRSLPQGPAPDELPPGTQRREFNGLTYYLMPIREDGQTATAEAATLAAPAR